mgnify:CR=1 FL=1
MTMARTTAVAIGANKAMRPKMIPRTPRIMAKIQIFFAKLGKPVSGVRGTVADMSRILSELARNSMAGYVFLVQCVCQVGFVTRETANQGFPCHPVRRGPLVGHEQEMPPLACAYTRVLELGSGGGVRLTRKRPPQHCTSPTPHQSDSFLSLPADSL